MFDWHISLNNGRSCFEGSDLDQVINNMIQHYAINELDPQPITLIAAYDEEGVLIAEYTNETSPLRLGEIQERFEEGVTQWKKEVQQNQREQKMTHSDLRMVLI